MPLIITCAVLLAAGIVATIVWGGERFRPAFLHPSGPSADGADLGRVRHSDGLRLYLWWATVFTVIGTATGILITGAGGRLIMRLLAATSPEAVGRFTEAQASVGEISIDGTIAFVVFGALPFSFASAALYLLVVPWLPPGRLGGLVLGALMLITVAPFIDPLRADNIDFILVGPGWLAVSAFALLALLQGAALAAIAGRLSRSLPVLTRRTWATATPLLIAVVLFPLGLVLLVGALVTFAFPRALPWFLDIRASPGGILVGRILLIIATLAALPAFIAAAVSIWTR